MPRQRRHPAGLSRHKGNAVQRADQKPRAVKRRAVARLDERCQVAERHSHGAQVQPLGTARHLFQPAAVLKAVDHIAIVQRGQAHGVARFVARLAVGADHIVARGGEGRAVHALVGLQVHERFCGGAMRRRNRGHASSRVAKHGRILDRAAAG